jgi:hypothetical protein
MTDTRILLQLDGRHRLSLGKLAKHLYYLAVADEDGVITLTPMAVVPAVTEKEEK